MKPLHKLPSQTRIKKAIGLLKKKMSAEPDHANASYRRGVFMALLWTTGNNLQMQRDVTRRKAKVGVK